jgi:excinuclease ABC subunit A
VRVRVDGETYDLATPPKLNRNQNHDVAIVVDRLVVRATDSARLADSLETALRTANGIVEIAEHGGAEVKTHLFSERYACVHCGTSIPELEPRQFSFNSPYGACEACGGLGTRREVSPELVVGDPIISILEGVILPWGEPTGHLRKSVIPGLAQHFGFDPNRPWGELPEPARAGILQGTGRGKVKFPYRTGGTSSTYTEPWEGVLANVMRRYEETSSESVREQLEAYMTTLPCRACGGARLKPESLAVTVGGKSIGDAVAFSITDALSFFADLNRSPELPQEIAGPILKEVRERLQFLVNVGLE